MKPKIFLSHSKADKKFIEKIANDLKAARIDVWYDDWEIPPGVSFRRQITKGIEEADLFFIYLTENSVESYWVRHELDTAFINQEKSGKDILAIFIDSDDVRKKLPTDIQAIHSPVFNDDDYLRPFSQLISNAWESYSEKIVLESKFKSRYKQLELETKIKSLELTIEKNISTGFADTEKIIDEMVSMKYFIAEKEVTLRDIYKMLVNDFATSSSLNYLNRRLLIKLKVEHLSDNLKAISDYRIVDIVGQLVVIGLVHLDPAHGEILDDYYYLTELGKKVARRIGM